jgi:hypothetical protein
VVRKCERIISTKDGKRAIYVDSINKKEILEYLKRDERHKKKFKYITDIILGGHKNTDLYDKEDINEKCRDVTAMKFFKGQENDRIFCKEIHTSTGTHIIVTSILHERKKNSELSAKEIAVIEKVGGYLYEI